MGKYPKIGIRPTIDGRRNGVRESIEASTSELAKSVAQFIEANIRYPDGSPAECVIADENIGGVPREIQARERRRVHNCVA